MASELAGKTCDAAEEHWRCYTMHTGGNMKETGGRCLPSAIRKLQTPEGFPSRHASFANLYLLFSQLGSLMKPSQGRNGCGRSGLKRNISFSSPRVPAEHSAFRVGSDLRPWAPSWWMGYARWPLHARATEDSDLPRFLLFFQFILKTQNAKIFTIWSLAGGQAVNISSDLGNACFSRSFSPSFLFFSAQLAPGLPPNIHTAKPPCHSQKYSHFNTI